MTSVTLQKAKRILATAGLIALAKRGSKQITNFVSVSFAMRAKRQFNDLETLLDYANAVGNGIVSAFQIRSEILGLLKLVGALKPRTVLEVGTANGGTLFLFTRVAAPDAHLISIDLPGGEFGDGYPAWKIPLYRSFALPGQRIDLVRADSHVLSTGDRVKSLLKDRPIDFLFIDGDHSYGGVKKDYQMYVPLVRPGGLIALHDIAKHASQDVQVEKFWNEIRRGQSVTELIAKSDQGWAGIGVVRAGAQSRRHIDSHVR
jgi:predicted O-methyltransferase YrrM